MISRSSLKSFHQFPAWPNFLPFFLPAPSAANASNSVIRTAPGTSGSKSVWPSVLGLWEPTCSRTWPPEFTNLVRNRAHLTAKVSSNRRPVATISPAATRRLPESRRLPCSTRICPLRRLRQCPDRLPETAKLSLIRNKSWIKRRSNRISASAYTTMTVTDRFRPSGAQ